MRRELYLQRRLEERNFFNLAVRRYARPENLQVGAEQFFCSESCETLGDLGERYMAISDMSRHRLAARGVCHGDSVLHIG